jgi:hypothetical protein
VTLLWYFFICTLIIPCHYDFFSIFWCPISFYHAPIAVVFTNSTFSKNATELAKTAQVLLWDRTKLVEMINALSDECIQWLINGD